jgi:hypothetical protein
MRTSFLLIASALSILCCTLQAGSAQAVCPKPDPRVCAEFFKSDVVFVGTVTREKKIPLDKELFDSWKYTLRVKTIFRGNAGSFVTVFTDNDSVRYPLAVGETYLLFLFKYEGRLMIANCGNNKKLSEARETIQEIQVVLKGMSSAHGGVIAGVVQLDYAGYLPAEGVIVNAFHYGKKYSTVTNKDGSFQLQVPAGAYVVRLRSKDHKFIAYDFSYDDPEWVIVHRGGCAQLMFVEPQTR